MDNRRYHTMNFLCQFVSTNYSLLWVQNMWFSNTLVVEIIMCIVVLLLLHSHFFIHSSMTSTFIFIIVFFSDGSSISSVFRAWHICFSRLLHNVPNRIICHILWTAEITRTVFAGDYMEMLRVKNQVWACVWNSV